MPYMEHMGIERDLKHGDINYRKSMGDGSLDGIQVPNYELMVTTSCTIVRDGLQHQLQSMGDVIIDGTCLKHLLSGPATNEQTI